MREFSVIIQTNKNCSCLCKYPVVEALKKKGWKKRKKESTVCLLAPFCSMWVERDHWFPWLPAGFWNFLLTAFTLLLFTAVLMRNEWYCSILAKAVNCVGPVCLGTSPGSMI